MKSSGFLIINKPIGITSFDVIRNLRKITGIRKIGHAGTLDPFASGIMIIGMGNYTRLLDRIIPLNKEYIAKAKLGIATDTADLTGMKMGTSPIPETIPKNDLQNEVMKIKQQLPPKFSAIKINGKPAYRLARENREFELTPRQIKIIEFEILGYEYPFLTYRALVSKGTYIRTLTEQIASILDTKATTIELIRTAIGHIKLKEAIDLSNLDKGNWEENLRSVTDFLPEHPRITLQKKELEDFFQGRRFKVEFEDYIEVVVIDDKKNCLGLAEINSSILKPRVVLK